MRKSQLRRLLNLFAFGTLAFAIYLVAFHKEEKMRHPAGHASVQIQEQNK